MQQGEEVEVYEAKKYEVDGYFWCKYFLEVGENQSCGTVCKGYNPCNKVNGKCRHHSKTFYEPTGRKFLIKKTNI